MCPNCRAFISSADSVCPYCETQIRPPAAAARRGASPTGAVAGLIPHARFTTSMIMLINFALFLASMLYATQVSGSSFDIPGQVLYRLGAKYGPAISNGDWWRLITAGALHGGLFHLLMNSWILFDLGSQVEETYGSTRLIIFYVLSTMGGFYASYLWSPTLSVGASAGVFGLIGVMIALGLTSRNALGDYVKALYTKWAIYALLFSFVMGLVFPIDHAAHIGGLAAGFGSAYVAGMPSSWATGRENLVRWVSYGCVILTATAFFLMFRQLVVS